MFLAFIGNDTMASKSAVKMTVQRLQSEMPGTSVVKLDDQNFNIGAALDTLVEGNLFAPKNIIIFDDILSHQDGEQFYLKNDLNSEHIIIVRETAPKKAVLDRLSKYGEVKTFSLEKAEKAASSFVLGDAVMLRDKKRAWVEFEKSRRKGDVPEAIHGMLFWVFKTLSEVTTLPKAEVLAAGIKGFTYTKGLEGSKKYSKDEIAVKFDELKEMYHRAHRGECDLEYSLEQFLLKL